MASSKVKGTPEERLMAAIFGKEPWDPRFPLCYPDIIAIEEDGKERKLGLAEAIQNALGALPLTNSRGRIDPEGSDRHRKVLELRFGLKDGIPRTLRQVGQELGIRHQQQVRQMEGKALHMMRHPSRSKKLRKFFVPSPEEIGANEKELQRYREALHRMGETEERTDRLVALLKSAGLSEEDTPQTAQASQEARADQEALRALRFKFPNMRVWSAVGRRIRDFSTLRAMVGSGEIREVRNIGLVAEAFLRRVLQAVEQEAPFKDIPQREDQEDLHALIVKFPNTRVWNAVMLAHISDLSKLRTMVGSGEIREFRNIGLVAEAFLRRVLQAVE